MEIDRTGEPTDLTEAELALVRDAAFVSNLGALPWATLALVGMCAALYFWVVTLGGGDSEREVFLLLVGGAKVNALISQGEWWRLVASAFLHGSFPHLVVNCLGVLMLGWLVEKSSGPGLALVTFVLSSAAGGLTSFAAQGAPSVGASGGMFGLLGAALTYALFSWQAIPRFVRVYLVGLPALVGAVSIGYGFAGGNIDNYAHLGGGVCGLALGYAWHNITRLKVAAARRLTDVLAALALLVASYCAGAAGMHLMLRFDLPETHLRVERLADDREVLVPDSWERGVFREGRCATGELGLSSGPACYVDPFFSMFLVGPSDRLEETAVYAEYTRRQEDAEPELFVNDSIFWKRDTARGLAFALLSFDRIADKYRPVFHELVTAPPHRADSPESGKPGSQDLAK